MEKFTGKTLDEAISLAIKNLNVKDKSELEINVVTEGSKGFLGFGAKEAVVEAKVKFEPKKIITDFIKEITIAMDILVDVEITEKENTLNVNLVGENLGILIGKHGQTLDSIQHLTSLTVNKGKAQYVNIILDCENYRSKRRVTLEKLARNLAKKVRDTKKSVYLEPMSSYERRIIHSALQDAKDIHTHSEGKDGNRHIIISLKKK
ncbi:MAG: RNA-binding cell elongation regulator Jag/EloR [Lachnospirales bacterium]